MGVKLTVIVLVALALLVDITTAGVAQFYRDLFYNRSLPNSQELQSLHLKCLPGRTIIKVTERQQEVAEVDDYSDEFTRTKSNKYRRAYHGSDLDERCSMCICSADGQNEVCLKRPAGSVNECILIHTLTKKAETGEPFEHVKSLPFRIRRDLIWHNDEIPYDPAAKCYRGHSYYTNHDTPNDTNINYNDDVNSLLDFKSQSACFFCVCSVSGDGASCISRSLWFCNYLRYLRSDKSGRDMYANMFQQDRPAYFRQLSWRLRRTMDNSMFDLMEQVGGVKADQGQKDAKTCVPFVSEYSDCNPETERTGCTKCVCSAAGMWECQPVHLNDQFETDNIDEELLDAAIDKLDYEKKELDDKMRQFYVNFHPGMKIYKPNKLIDVFEKNNQSKSSINTIENISNSSIITYKKKDISNKSINTIGKKDNIKSSISAIEKNDVSNGLTSIVVKEVDLKNAAPFVEKKENSRETIGSVEKKIDSTKSISTDKNNESSNESESTIEKKDGSKESISIAAKKATPNKAVDTIKKKHKSDPHIELKNQKLRQRLQTNRYAPEPKKKDESEELLEIMNNYKPEQRLKEILNSRQKRAAVTKNENKHNKRSTDRAARNRHTRNSNNINNTVKFYSTVDELNEDTLKHSNISGTLHARRVELNVLPDMSRRSNTIENSNKSLHIDFNQPKEFNHITDNKIDVTDHDNKFDLSHEKLNVILGNHTQKTKDKILSKLVVNELNAGTEVIGNSHAPVTSNITFTSENDTLTAMAFIAGNLLNKLWNMEKDASGFSSETEDMKYEKISDLLDLFKEPLNLRQEAFLKNALEQLSSAIDKNKDIKNITICQTIEEATKLIDTYNNTDDIESPIVSIKAPCKKNNSSKKDKSNRSATIKAISKINNVLELMKKFENVQTNISVLKNETVLNFNGGNNSTPPTTKNNTIDNSLTKDETSSLNVFGNILNKITKLLLPKNSKKRLANTLKSKNELNNNQNLKNNFLKKHHIDLTNMTVSAKDKIILDYITHINSNPDCILNKKHPNTNPISLPSIEGNILLNLSEFFKMKSFADLINLLQPKKEIGTKDTYTVSVTTKKVIESAKTTSTIESTTVTSAAEKTKKFASTKEKLKAHLKSIIEDLIELQNSKGIVTKSNIKIADALPCIYKIMNVGKDIPNKNNEEDNSPDRIVNIFNALKNDMKVAQTRRSDSVMQIRPKSAVVLERVIKNFVEKSKVQTRRFAKIRVSKPIEELRKIMDKLRNVSSIYKNKALYDQVSPAEKLVLLKTLEEDLRHYIIALEGIKRTYQNLNQLPAERYDDLATFVDNSATNISLDAKVIKKVEKLDIKNHVIDEMDSGYHIFKDALPKKPFGMLSGGQDDDDNMKISRNEIINHLIGNRMKIYIKLKEAKQFDLSNDMNYNIAKRVLFYLDSGNYNLAHELFKMLVMQKHDKLAISSTNDGSSDFAAPTPKVFDVTNRQGAMPRLMPVIQLEEPTTPTHQMKWMSQDHLIKQLLNIKNMGL